MIIRKILKWNLHFNRCCIYLWPPLYMLINMIYWITASADKQSIPRILRPTHLLPGKLLSDFIDELLWSTLSHTELAKQISICMYVHIEFDFCTYSKIRSMFLDKVLHNNCTCMFTVQAWLEYDLKIAVEYRFTRLRSNTVIKRASSWREISRSKGDFRSLEYVNKNIQYI